MQLDCFFFKSLTTFHQSPHQKIGGSRFDRTPKRGTFLLLFPEQGGMGKLFEGAGKTMIIYLDNT